MKIELGRCYKTRDGRKARVVCVDAMGQCPILVLIQDGKEESAFFHWENGESYDDENDDLIAPWEEESPVSTTSSNIPANDTYDLTKVSERWMPVYGYETNYEISDFGRVRRVTRRNGERRPEPKILTPALNSRGYPSYSMYRHGQKKTEMAHRMVALTFLGPPESPDMECAHLDGDYQNPNLSNLKWVTAQENNHHKWEHGTQLFGENCYNSEFKSYEVATIKILYALGVRATDIGKMFGISKSQAHGLATRQWLHLDPTKELIDANIALRAKNT